MMRAAIVLLFAVSAALAQRDPLDIQALMKFARVSEPLVAPDGKTVVYTVQTTDLDRNTRTKQIWSVALDGAAPRQLTRDGSNERPRWSPDSKRIAFISDRGGSSQVWTMDASGSDPKQITNLSTEAGGVLFSPDGKNLLFTSDVFPDCGADDACNRRKLEEEKTSKVRARIYTQLLYRHWTRWQAARRSHLMVAPAGGGAVKDLTPGSRDVPPFSLGGGDEYAISPDGNEVCYSVNTDPQPAASTNSDLFVVPIGGGEARRITANLAADSGPQYSPDGRYLAYRAQTRPGYESDRWRLVVMDRTNGRPNVLTEALDRWVQSFAWTPDSKRLVFVVEDRGRTSVQMIPVTGGSSRVLITGSSHIDDVEFTGDGKTMVYSENSGTRPVELFRVSSIGGAPVAMTHVNDELIARYAVSPLEEFWVEGAEKTRVHSFMIKPPGFSLTRKYPVLFFIHGGPQGAWGESWSYRWNPQVFANAGYLVVMPNPRGSTGYGERFTDEINGDWGGRPYDDIMAVVDHVAGLPFADPDRMVAAGGSYGGYMVDWMLGHTNRFKAFVSHAGVYDLRSMAGETEELWFPLWEFKGMPWDNPEMYARWSPSYYAKDFKTPTLVIHGELDYRVPYGQGLQLFTALQMQKIPSKLLLFPDEGHWILKPQNSVLWYRTFLDWIDQWTKRK